MSAPLSLPWLAFLVPLTLAAGCAGTPAAAAPATTAPRAASTLATLPPAPSAARPPPASPSGSTLTWYGHAAFKLVTPKGKVLWFDPWLTNPKNPSAKHDLATIGRADLVLVSHGHADHIGDAVTITKATGAKLVATGDLGRSLVEYQGVPKEAYGYDTGGNFGGEIALLEGEVRIRFVPAVHSSSVSGPEGKPDSQRPGGNPGGFVVSVQNGPTIYHTGDTDLFSDMALVAQSHPVDVMLACIGDHFTMGPERAAEAVRLVAPAMVVPMHYGTFPVFTGTPEAFETALRRRGLKTQLKTMQVHEEMKL